MGESSEAVAAKTKVALDGGLSVGGGGLCENCFPFIQKEKSVSIINL